MEGTAFSPRTPAEVAGRGERRAGRAARGVLGREDALIVAAVAECEALRSHLAAVEAAALAEVEGRKIAKQQLAWSSTADWFTHAAGIHRRTVPRRSGTRRRWSPTGPRDPRRAVRHGLVSPEQAGIICDAIDETPHQRRDPRAGREDPPGRLHATDLAKAARHLIHVVDPEGTERKAEKDLKRQDRAAHLNRFLAIVEDGAGGVRLRGRGTVEDAAKIKAAPPLTNTPADQEALDCGRTTTAPGCGTRSSRPAGTRWPRPAARRARARPRVAVTTFETLRDRIDWTTLGDTVTDDGSELSPAAIRRLACEPRSARWAPAVRSSTSATTPPPRHPGAVAGAGVPRPALRVPRLHQLPVMGPCAPHRALGRPRPHLPGQPGAVRAPPPGRPPHPLAGSGSTRSTADPSSSPHPNPGHHPPPQRGPRRE